MRESRAPSFNDQAKTASQYNSSWLTQVDLHLQPASLLAILSCPLLAHLIETPMQKNYWLPCAKADLHAACQ